MAFRTLLLEDDHELRQLLTLILKRRGHQVAAFASPLHCPLFNWQHCRCDRARPCYDFLISDNNMPGMSGLEFLRLQEERGCLLGRRQKALISGHFQPKDVEQAAAIDCQVFRKPVDWQSFTTWLGAGEEFVTVGNFREFS